MATIEFCSSLRYYAAKVSNSSRVFSEQIGFLRKKFCSTGRPVTQVGLRFTCTTLVIRYTCSTAPAVMLLPAIGPLPLAEFPADLGVALWDDPTSTMRCSVYF